MKRYKDMNDKELADMVKKTKSDRATMRLRLGESADLSAYDKQIEELTREIVRRRNGQSKRNT